MILPDVKIGKAREKRMRVPLCQGDTPSTARLPICTLRSSAKVGKTSRRNVSRNAVRQSPMTAAEATVASLIAHGIDTIYALPGVHNDFLFEALFKAGDRIRTVHTRHEQGAAYMALGAALATDRPHPYAVVPGPGLLNTGAALLTAYSMNAPVLALIGQIPDADIGKGISAICTKSATRPASSRGWSIFPPGSASPKTAPRLVAEAMRAMARPARPGGAGMRHRHVGRKAAPSRCSAAAGPATKHRRGRRSQAAAQAPRRRQAPDDRLRRRRAGRVRRSHRSCPPCCRRRCSPIAAAAACSTAATR